MKEPLYTKIRAMLIAADFTHTRSIESQDPLTPEHRFEFWSGSKGSVVLQIWRDGAGVAAYCDWGLGLTMDELEGALK